MTRLFRSITSLLLCGTLLVVTAPVGASAEEDTVQTISTKEELTQIRQNSSGKYRLTANIEFLPEDFAPGGAFYNSRSAIRITRALPANWMATGTRLMD